MNTGTQTPQGIQVTSFDSMSEVIKSFPFIGELSPAQVAVVPMNPPKVAFKSHRANTVDLGIEASVAPEVTKRSKPGM